MKFLKYMFYALVFVVSALVGAYIFAPLDEFGLYAFESVRLEAANRGYYVTHEGMSRRGRLNPEYRVTSLDVEGPMAKATFSHVSVKLYFLQSLLGARAKARVEFGETVVAYIPDSKLSLVRGAMDISAARGAVAVEEADVEGDVGMTGGFVFDAASRAVRESTAIISVPPNIGVMLGTPMMRRFVEPASDGKWRVRENASRSE